MSQRLGWLAGMLQAQPGDRIGDLGCGSGAALAVIANDLAVDLVGVDSDPVGLRAAAGALGSRRGTAWLLVQADLTGPLPLANATLDRALCDNLLGRPRDAAAVASGVHRLLRPGGRAVFCQADLDTLMLASEDAQLTRRLVQTYCDSVDGTLGRRLGEVVAHAGLLVEDVQARINLGRRFRPGELGYVQVERLVRVLGGSDTVDEATLDRWLAGLKRLDSDGRFMVSVNDYAVAATRP